MSNEFNDNIVIIEKPDSISYEQIQALLHSAHGSNKEKGMKYGVADQSIEELEKELKKNTICYVAMDGEKMVGTMSFRYARKRKAFLRINSVYMQLLGVSPDCKGHHIADRLWDRGIKDAEEKGYKIFYGFPAEDNLIIHHMYLKRGFVKASYTKYPRNNFFSVGFIRTPYKLVNKVLASRYEEIRKKVRAEHNLDD